MIAWIVRTGPCRPRLGVVSPAAARRFGPLIALVVLAGPATSARAALDSYLYVGDVDSHQVFRFDAATGAQIGSGPYIKDGGEGMGGTNRYLALASGSSKIDVYDVATNPDSPTLVRTINTPGYSALGIAFSTDATKLYAGSITNYPGGSLVEYDFNTGALLHHIDEPTKGIWGVTINPANGKVYWTTGWASGAGAAIYSANSDLSNPTQIVGTNANGITALVGITFKADGTFYAVNGGNADPNNGFINHYAADGTFLDRVNMAGMPANALYNAFDTEIGPDGNLYVSSQNGACVVEFNAATDSYTKIFIAPQPGIQTAKTIHFTSNNVSGVPEPPAAVLLGLGMASASAWAGWRRRRRPAA